MRSTLRLLSLSRARSLHTTTSPPAVASTSSLPLHPPFQPPPAPSPPQHHARWLEEEHDQKDYVDQHFPEWEELREAEEETARMWDAERKSKGKGKGKARMDEYWPQEEEVEVEDEDGFPEWIKQEKELLNTSSTSLSPPPPPPPPPVKLSPSTITTPLSTSKTSFDPLLHIQKRSQLSTSTQPFTSKNESTALLPYLPPPYDTSSSIPPQPHHYPLLSRTDWRLSSPLSPPSPSPSFTSSSLIRQPPSLSLSTSRNTSTQVQGVNKFVGIGLPPREEARRWNGTKDEIWGWKVKVPESEKTGWKSADEWKKGPERLIELTRESDASRYLTNLNREGRTPARREELKLTVCRAVGNWKSNSVREKVVKALSLRDEEKSKLGGGAGRTLISEWEKEDGESLVGWRWEEGQILRFTKLSSIPSSVNTSSSSSDDYSYSSRPKLSLSAILAKEKEAFFVQGQLIEITESGKAVVAFFERDAFDIGSGNGEDGEGSEVWRIDEGHDDSSLAIQLSALQSLYYDPLHQSQRNQIHIQSAQDAFVNSSGNTVGKLREWGLTGTGLRELIVPDLRELEEKKLKEVEMKRMREVEEQRRREEKVLDESLGEETTSTSTPTTTPTLSELDLSLTPSNPSDLFTSNQLINSWILRYSRPTPLVIPGDPELGLNPSQLKAIAMALRERLSLVQGPPGTGKSALLVSLLILLKKHFRLPIPILLCAPTHVSVDHLLSLLITAGLNPLRTGRSSRVREELREWTLEKRQGKHPLWERMEGARVESEERRRELVEWREGGSKKGKKGNGKEEEVERELEAIYKKAWNKFIWYEQRLYSSLLSSVDVVCSTTLGSGPNKIINMIDFPIVFVDEAAMCTEPTTLVPLMKGAVHATLIGDHKQLPAVITSKEAKVERLHESMFERLMVQGTVQSTLLSTQYRMRPSISGFPNATFYNSQLSDDQLVLSRRPPPLSQFLTDPSSSSIFLSHSYPESTNHQNGSSYNVKEVDIVVSLVGDLLLKNPTLEASSIGIISPYATQMKRLRETFGYSAVSQLTSLLGPIRAEEVSRVEINTVDAFQGREKDVIIFSTVRSNDKGLIGFLTDRRRLNVALTRARDALFVVGNEKTLRGGGGWIEGPKDKDADGEVWRVYLDWMREKGWVREWREEDFLVRSKRWGEERAEDWY